MKIKRLYLLFIFVFSLLITNLYYSNIRPSLIEYKTNDNIVLVANNDFHNSEIISTNLTYQNDFIVEHHLSYEPIFIAAPVILVLIYTYRMKSKPQYFKDIFEYYGIIFRYRKRILIIWYFSFF